MILKYVVFVKFRATHPRKKEEIRYLSINSTGKTLVKNKKFGTRFDSKEVADVIAEWFSDHRFNREIHWCRGVETINTARRQHD